METHIEGTMYGDFYRWFNVWRLKCRVQGLESHIEGKMNGDSYRGSSVFSLI